MHLRQNVCRAVVVLMIGPHPPSTGGIASYIRDLNHELREEHGLNIISIAPYVVKSHKISELLLKVWIALLNTIKIVFFSLKYNCVLGHVHTSSKISFFENSLYILLLKYICRIPVVLHLHAPDFDTFLREISQPFRHFVTFIFSLCDKVIVLSEYWKEVMREVVDSNKLIIIPNAISSKFFVNDNPKNSKELLDLPPNSLIIFSLGNLIERKGFNYLIDAMSGVVSQKRNVLCFIGGKGPIKKNLQDQIIKLDLQEKVKLVGFIEDEFLPTWMNACDVFVFPSLQESFGLVQVEAMACGKPSVATYNHGSEDIIISSEYGLLCEPADSKDLENTILYALEKKWDPDKIKKYAENFQWSLTSNKILAIYRQVSKL